MNSIRISLVEKNSEIRGSIQAQGDGAFRFEALAFVIKTLADKWGVTSQELLNDLKGFLK